MTTRAPDTDRQSELADGDARERIIRGRGRSLAIDAGAGTGKTRLLVNHVLARVEAGGDLHRLAIITFTRKAAAELERRIRTELAKRGGEARFEEALAQLEHAPIGTTDSFCRALLADVALEAGISPGFAIADEVAASAIRDRAWARLLAHSTPAHEDLATRLREAGVHLRHVRSVAERVLDHRDLALPRFAAPAPEPLLPKCLAIASELEAVRPRCMDPEDRLVVKVCAALAAIRQASALPARYADAHLIESRGPRKFGTHQGKQASWGGARFKEAAATALARLDQEADAFVEARSTHLAGQALDWIREYVDEVAQVKRERAVLDFRDLALVTRDLLCRDERLREKLASRFDEILLDEAQDSDPLQMEIAFLLAAARADAKDPIASRVQPGKLFLVGDPKQSIYRFRRADIELYERARESLGAGGGHETIVVNFRSHPGILDFVNEVFSVWMAPVEGAHIQARYVPLLPDPKIEARVREEDGAGRSEPRVRVLLPDRGLIREILATRRLEELDVGVIQEAEADAVARAVIHVLGRDGSPPCTVRDPETKESRPARAGDVAVLVRRIAQGDAIQDALHGAGVPSAVSGGKRFYAREEIATLTAVLRAVTQPGDAFARLTALRSSAFGFDDDLLVLHTLGKSTARHPRAGELRDALASLERWTAQARRSSPGEFLPFLVEELSLFTLFGLRHDGQARAAALAMLVDAAESLEDAGLDTIPDIADWLASQDGEARAEPPGELDPGDEDAVQVLTMHKAKGLEFPIVILADFGTERRGPDANVVTRRTEGTLEVRFGMREARVETPGFKVAFEEEKVRQAAEEVRLLYVAMTRARDHLILSWMPLGSRSLRDSPLAQWVGAEPGAAPPEGGPVPAILADALPALPEVETHVRANVARARAAAGPSRIEAWAPQREEARRGAFVIRASGGDDTEPGANVGPEIAIAADSPSSGAPFGEIVHRAMERVDFADPASAARALGEALASIAGGAPSAVRDHVLALDDAGRASLRGFLERVLRDREVAQLARAPRLHREVPFILPAGGDFLTGAVDVLAESTDGSLWVFDYKTDRLVPKNAAALPLRYRRQALLSSFAIATITGRPVRAFRFLYVAADPVVAVTIDIDEDVLAEARSLVQSTRVKAGKS